MDPTVAAAVIGGLIALISLIVSVVTNAIITIKTENARSVQAADQLAAEIEDRDRQREHERRERRYEDRLEAYTALVKVSEGMADSALQREEEGRTVDFDPGPADYAQILAPVYGHLATVKLLAGPAYGEAAQRLVDVVGDYYLTGGSHKNYVTARNAFMAAAQTDLGSRMDKDGGDRPLSLTQKRMPRKLDQG